MNIVIYSEKIVRFNCAAIVGNKKDIDVVVTKLIVVILQRIRRSC